MKRKLTVSLAAALVALFSLAPAAFAGGGGIDAVFDSFPARVSAGRPVTIRFQAWSACMSGAMEGLNLHMTFIKGNMRIKAIATATGAGGHYAATVTLPESGEWRWVVVDEAGYLFNARGFVAGGGGPRTDAPAVFTVTPAVRMLGRAARVR
jgi:hypothetical protein